MKKLLLLMIISGTLFSCSEKKDTTTSYVGPGSEYSITFNESDGTFDLTESDSSLTIAGSYTTLTSGFKKLTVGSVSGGGDEKPSVGDQAYGVDIPGVVFLLKPLEANSEIVSMVSKGSCPTGDFNMNWIITGIDSDDTFRKSCVDGQATPTGVDALGTFSFNASTEVGSLPNLYDICGNEVGDQNQSLGKITCSNGIGEPAQEDQAKMYLTANGGAIVKMEDDGGGVDDDDDKVIVGLPVNTVVKASLADEYIGMIMMNNPGGQDSVHLIKASVDTDAVITFSEINPDTNEDITSNFKDASATMTDINQPSTGFSRGTYTVKGSDGAGGYVTISNKKVTCMSNQNINGTSKNFIFCVGEEGSGADQMLNVLLVSK